jgi:hypothetical protein
MKDVGEIHRSGLQSIEPEQLAFEAIGVDVTQTFHMKTGTNPVTQTFCSFVNTRRQI